MVFARLVSLPPARYWAAFILVIFTLSIAGVSAAAISSVTITPPDPTEDDSVTIAVAGWFPDSCWSLSDFDCGAPAVGQIAFDVYAVDVWIPDVVCAQVIIPYACACDYDPLAAGHYVVTVTEHHDSLRDPFPDVFVVEFDVAPVSPVEKTTWGCIRALYR